MLASTLDEYSRLLCYPPFPLLSYFWLMQPDGGPQELDANPDDHCYYPEGAYYYVEPADDQE